MMGISIMRHLAIIAGVDQASGHWLLGFHPVLFLTVLMFLVWLLSLFYRALFLYFKLFIFGGGGLGGIDLHQHMHFATCHER